MTYIVDREPALGAFGEQMVAELTPVFQSAFNYHIHPDLWGDHSNGGSLTVVDNMAVISTTAAANKTGELQSLIPLRYKPGQGALARFTALFTTGVANSEQLAGIGDAADGLGFGYDGADFGIKYWHNGSTEVRTLTITTASSDVENVTVTLDGDAASVPVTDSANITTTANEIASFDFSAIGSGWSTHAIGDMVEFTSFIADTQGGAYSISGTSVVGSFAQIIVGSAETEEWIAQTSWNKDPADGTGIMPSLDTTKGNVFAIQYQWLGFGDIDFYINDPVSKKFILVHRIEYANANTRPSINNPTLPALFKVKNTSNTSNIQLKTGSVGLFIEGRANGEHTHHGVSNTKTGITTETPVLSILNKGVFQGKINRAPIRLTFTSIAADGTKPVLFRFKSGDTLTDASFSDVETNGTVISFDTSATASTGGDELFGVGLSRTGSETISLATASVSMTPNSHLTVTAESANSTDVTVSFNWEDLF